MNLKMNPKHLMLALCSCLSTSLFAQNNDEQTEHQKAHIGFVYPLSTNGTHAAKISNTISFHLLAGLSAGEDGFALSGLSTVIKGDQSGIVISGISNTIKGDAKGLQIAGLVNTVAGDGKGISVSGLVNIHRSINGIQIGGLSNVSKNNATFQVASLSNTSSSSAIQISGIFNTSKAVKGIQIAGLVNVSNKSNSQIAGLVNIAKKVSGVQLAGLVNIAEESDYPIGFINIIKNGEKQIGATIDEAGNTILALRTGGKYTYGIIGAGYNVRMDNAPYVLEVGFGTHIPFSKAIRLNLEVSNTANTNFGQESYYKSSLRPLIGFNFAKHFELVVGPSFNYVNYMSFLKPYQENTVYKFFGTESTNSLFFGGMAGLHIRI